MGRPVVSSHVPRPLSVRRILLLPVPTWPTCSSRNRPQLPPPKATSVGCENLSLAAPAAKVMLRAAGWLLLDPIHRIRFIHESGRWLVTVQRKSRGTFESGELFIMSPPRSRPALFDDD